MGIEVEFRNVGGETAAIGSAGPYTLVVDRRRTAAVAGWASTAASCCTSRSAAVSEDVEVAGDAPREQLVKLVSHVDAIAEIPNSVRRGTAVKLSSVRIIPR
jgi:putative redox protein